MKLTAIGAGAIGGNLARKLAAAGHDVQVADARGPEAVPADVLETRARVVPLDSAVRDRDVITMSIPFEHVPELADVLALVSDETVVIDTTNYYPHLSGPIEAVDSGQVESVRNAEALGWLMAKAWNAAGRDLPDARGSGVVSASAEALLARPRVDVGDFELQLCVPAGAELVDGQAEAGCVAIDPGERHVEVLGGLLGIHEARGHPTSNTCAGDQCQHGMRLGEAVGGLVRVRHSLREGGSWIVVASREVVYGFDLIRGFAPASRWCPHR
jgi:choline dehydrogenase-like flavoprotein